MKRNWIVATVVSAFLGLSVMARAHEGHDHKVMGTIESINGNHLMVKTTEGQTKMVMIDIKTAITRGKTKLDATAVKVGDRIVAEGAEDKSMLTAKTLKLGTATDVKK